MSAELNPGPRTYNDNLINEKSRSVFYKSLSAIERMLDAQDTMNPEKLHALAAAADAAACGFEDEEPKNEYE